MSDNKLPSEGCCGSINNQASIVVRTAQVLSAGHASLAMVYKSLAEASKDDNDKALFMAAMERQMDLAKRSQEVTLPNEFAETVAKGGLVTAKG